MRLLVVRHGETEENSKKILQGVLPGKLTTLGQKQAKDLAEKLRTYKINKIYCSPIDRCKQTLEIVVKEMKYKGEIEYTDLVRERDFGKFSGKPRSEINYNELDKDTPENKAMGVETQEAVNQRIKKFIDRINEENKEVVLVISHSNPIRWIWVNLTKISFREALETVTIENGEIKEFDYSK